MPEDMTQNLPTTYYEKQIDKTLYRVTNIYKGEIDFDKAAEELLTQKISDLLNSKGLGNGTAKGI
ncbi:MAG: hypothetical protein FWC32_10850 [Firmicutes bacterium]|nr:hypothetical protein [Bacillota bacterium]